MVFDLRDRQNNLLLIQHNYEVCNALFNALMNVANALQNVANAFKNNFSALESVSNGLKYIVMRCQCISQRIFNAFFTYLLCRVFANRVTCYIKINTLLH